MISAQHESDMVECPYNAAHRMLRKRLQSHLIKCRVNYPDVELQTCPFNKTHMIPEPEFVHHVTGCPDRKLITQYKYEDSAIVRKKEEPIEQKPIECEDNWDDVDVQQYNPRDYAMQSVVLRRPVGHNQTERRAFMKEELKRYDEVRTIKMEEADFVARDEFPRPKKEATSSDDEDDTKNPQAPPPPIIDNWKPSNASPSARLSSNRRNEGSHTRGSDHDKRWDDGRAGTSNRRSRDDDRPSSYRSSAREDRPSDYRSSGRNDRQRDRSRSESTRRRSSDDY